MDDYISRAFQEGVLTRDSPLVSLNGIGPYLLKRVRDTLKFENTPITIHAFVRKFRNKTAPQIITVLKLIMQNARANQCVDANSLSSRPNYHVQDVNRRGFDVCIALLRFAKRDPLMKTGLRFGSLRNAIVRSEDAKRCGCKARDECVGVCKWQGNTCIPSSLNARGFEGVGAEPGQRATFTNALQRQRLLNAASVKRTRRLYNDADALEDLNAGHALQMDYEQDGNVLWRRPQSRVRRPR